MSERAIIAAFAAISLTFFSCGRKASNAENAPKGQPSESNVADMEIVTDCTDETSGTQVSLRDGVVSIGIDKSRVMALGVIDESEYRIDRQSQKVTTTGTPKSVFIGDIGQDTNPIVGIITDDGHLEILSVYSAISTGNFITSGPLYGFSDIVKLKSGAVVNEYGAGYGTIFAVNDKGEEKEIPLWDFCGDLYHFDGNDDGSISLTFLKMSQDWRIAVSYGWFESEMAGQNLGCFWEIEPWAENNAGRYGFEFTEQFSFDLDESTEIKPKSISLKGEFTFRDNNNGVFTITTIDGQPIAGNLNEPTEFSVDSYPSFKNSVGVERKRILEYQRLYNK